jgi:hypothetical protein
VGGEERGYDGGKKVKGRKSSSTWAAYPYQATALVRGSGVSFSRWCSCGVLSLTVYSGVWGIGVFAYLLGEEMDFV